MLSIPPDWSFVFQVVGFLVFWGVMKVLLFDPIQKVLVQRNERVEGAQRRAQALTEEAERLDEKSEARLSRARADALLEGERIRRRAEGEERAIIERAREKSAANVTSAREAIGREIEAASADVAPRAQDLAAAVAATIMGRPI